VVVGGFVRSFEAVPVTQLPIFEADSVAMAATAMADLLLAALEIAAPTLGALLLAEVALAFAARFAPQANIFMIGLPLKLGHGVGGRRDVAGVPADLCRNGRGPHRRSGAGAAVRRIARHRLRQILNSVALAPKAVVQHQDDGSSCHHTPESAPMDGCSARTTLGVSSSASLADIKTAYRTLAKHAHPDRGGDAATFDRITRAYEFLVAEADRPSTSRPGPPRSPSATDSFGVPASDVDQGRRRGGHGCTTGHLAGDSFCGRRRRPPSPSICVAPLPLPDRLGLLRGVGPWLTMPSPRG
jgi:hypothetical protein